MPRTVTVTFADGSKHVYNGVPDDATPDAVEARAAKEFGKKVTALNGGRGATPAPISSPRVSLDQMRAFAGGTTAKPVGPIIDPARDFSRNVGGALDALVAGEKRRFAKTQRPMPANPIEFVKQSADDLVETGGRIGDVAALALSPLAGLTDAAISGPGSRLLAKYGPTAYTAPELSLNGGRVSLSPSRPMTKAETADAVRNTINMAMSAAKPARYTGGGVTMANGKLALRPTQPAEIRRVAPPSASPSAPNMAPVERKAMEYVDRLATQGNADLDALQALPEHMTGGEAIGQRGKSGLAALARREGETGDALNAAVNVRRTGRSDRMLEAFGEAAGVAPDAALGDIRSLVESGRNAAAPLYAASEQTPMKVSPRLMSLTERKPVKAAMDEAMSLLEGDVSIPPETLAAIKANPEASSAFWDYTHRALNDAAGAAIDQVTGKSKAPNSTRIATGLAREFGDALKEAHPPLREAMDVAGDYLSAESAFKAAGKDIFNAALNEADFAQKFGKMGAAEQQAYRGGIANRFYDLAQTGKLDPKVLKTPRVQAKLELALGKDRARQLIDFAAQEGDLLNFERRYAPEAGSITQEIRAAMDEQDAAGAAGQFASDLVGSAVQKGPVRAVVDATLKQGQRALDAIGPTRGMSIPVRDEAGRALLLPPSELAKALEAYRKLRADQKLSGATDLQRLFAYGRPAIPAAAASATVERPKR